MSGLRLYAHIWLAGIALVMWPGFTTVLAQSCGFDSYLSYQFRQNPAETQRLLDQEQMAYEQYIRSGSGLSLRNGCDLFTIPVVVHVIYANASANISDAQIQGQIQVLNEDFRRMDSTPGEGPGADSRIRFCLANRNPGGDSTSGIIRVQSSLGIHNSSDEDQLKALSNWDDQRYLNIWIVESLTLIDPNGQEPPQPILAYASYPTLPNGLPQGVVIDHRYVGTEGTAIAPFNGGRTLTHEIGHFLGLFHPFQSEGACSDASADNCLSNGDKVCDTPAQRDPTYGCPTAPTNTCEDRPCDAPDPTFNYLNYTDDACMNAFTEGQVMRMHFFLEGARSSLVDSQTLAMTACDHETPIINRPMAAFSQSSSATCIGGVVTFQAHTNACSDAAEWHFPGGQPAMAFSSIVTVTYDLPGTYPVTLIVSNAAGGDTLTLPSAVQTSMAIQAEEFDQGFEAGLVPPAGWQLEDPDGLGSWKITDLATRNGTYSAVLPQFDSPSCGDEDLLISPPIDMSGKPWELHFWYAYQRRNSNPSDVESFRIDVSDACGAPWLPVFFRTGDALATVNGEEDSAPFLPGNSDWEEIVIDLSEFRSSSHLRVRFRCLGRNGQNLYLDDVRLLPSTFVSADRRSLSPSVFPNPFSEQMEIRLEQTPITGLRLYDLQGRVVDQVNISSGAASTVKWAPQIAPGSYLLLIESRSRSWTTLVVKTAN